ncbi:MAG: hypothetical protein ACYS76_04445 [Planctomycetota bacterium]|jgi:hypothetical protein
MKIPDWIKIIYTLPNSPEGLRIRARKLDQEFDKTRIKNFRDMAELYRLMASYNWPVWKTRAFIEDNIRKPARARMGALEKERGK